MASAPPVCEFGWRAVDAILPGTDGNEHQISELAGPGGLVVAFICNHCPYVEAVADRLVRDARDLALLGIGFAAINSNDADAYPADSFENMKAFARRHGFGFPYLHDVDQSVARAYRAACTPDFFGFNADLQLQYRGRLDSAGRQPAGADTTRDLFNAMVEIGQTGEGPRDQVSSIGCSIKWKGGS